VRALLLRSGCPPLRTVSACADGSLNWAWAGDKFGQPSWVDLSHEVDWTDTRGMEPLDQLAWTAPAYASNRSFPAQFVAAVLALGTNVARPSAALMSDAAYNDECAPQGCALVWSEREFLNLSDAHLLSRCVLKFSSASSKERAEAYPAKSTARSAASGRPATMSSRCATTTPTLARWRASCAA
jgi:hypothetical protein